MQLSPLNQPQVTSDQEKTQLASNDVEEDWENPSYDEQAPRREVMTPSTSGSQTAHSGTSVSLRRKRHVHTETSSTSVTSPAPSQSRSVNGCKKSSIVNNEVVQEAFSDGVRYTTWYAFDVFKNSMERMRKPLSWFLFLYMFAWLTSRMTSTLRMALSPLCFLPGMSNTMLCVPVNPIPSVNLEKLVGIQGSTFEQLIGESAGGSKLSIDVLRAEMATRDLSLLVRYSDLKSKDSIADILDTIAKDAKTTGRGLTKLNAKVVGAIDEIMALNNYAMTTVEGAHNKAPSPFLRAISPVKLGPTAEEIIVEAFTIVMDESEYTIEKLILEAELSSQNLEQLDADIEALHEMITRENKHTTVERDKLLGQLWMQLFRRKMVEPEYGDRLKLLNDIGEYRKQAVAHVKAALWALRTMSEDLEVLRERVAAPGLLDGKLPLHVHMASIRNGLERLQGGRLASRLGGGIDDKMVRMIRNGASG